MPKRHFTSAGASIEYGNAGVLFPVEELDATVLQYRNAQLALADVDGSNVIVVFTSEKRAHCDHHVS